MREELEVLVIALRECRQRGFCAFWRRRVGYVLFDGLARRMRSLHFECVTRRRHVEASQKNWRKLPYDCVQ